MNKNVLAAVTAKFLLAPVLIFWVALYVYSGALENSLVSDSRVYLSDNKYITELNWENIKWMTTSTAVWNWHPVTWLSYATDYWIYGGLDPSGFHLTNNVLHGINSVLFYFVVLVLLGFQRSWPLNQVPINLDSKAIISSIIVATLFAVHPQHVESVVWVAERKDLLFLLFVFALFLAYIKYIVSVGRTRLLWYLVVCLCYALSLMSKPMAVTVPVLLLLLDVYPLRRTRLIGSTNQAVNTESYFLLGFEKLPLLLMSGFVIAVTILAQDSAISGLLKIPLSVRLFNAFDAILLYIQKLILPINLSPLYPHLHFRYQDVPLHSWLSALSCIAISVLAISYYLKGRQAWLVAWLFFLIALSPILGVIQVGLQGAADRYAYFTTLPAYVLLAAAIFIIFQRHNASAKALTGFGLSLVIILFSVLTVQQVRVWKNPVKLWSHAVTIHPDNGVAHSNLGNALYSIGEYALAVNHFERAQDLGQLLIGNLPLVALSYLRMNEYEHAFSAHAQLAINAETNPDIIANEGCIQYNMGWIFAQLGAPRDAIEMFSRVDDLSAMKTDATRWIEYLRRESVDGEPMGTPEFCQDLMRINEPYRVK